MPVFVDCIQVCSLYDYYTPSSCSARRQREALTSDYELFRPTDLLSRAKRLFLFDFVLLREGIKVSCRVCCKGSVLLFLSVQ